MSFLSWISTLLFPTRPTEELVRISEADTLYAHVAPTLFLHEELPITTLLPYREPLVAAHIIESKYHRNPRAVSILGHILAEYLSEIVADEDAYTVRSFALVPVPLSSTRFSERGYNQTEEITNAALVELGIEGHSHARLLRRTRDTKSQTRLPRAERLRNMHGAFEADSVDPDMHYILVDDVVTTGATLQAAHSALTRAGASHVICLALAH